MTLELNLAEEPTHAQESTLKEFKTRPCPYLFFGDEEDDFKYFKW